MYHDTSLAQAARAADPRPKSAVSTGCGVAGLVGLLIWVGVAHHYGMNGPYSALVNLLACGIPMVLWSVLVDKVHLNPSTGLDWSAKKPWRETIDISMTKLAGLWITWAGIALIYGTFRFYWDGGFAFAMWFLGMAAPLVGVLSIPYIIILDRYAVKPKDGCWALGAWLMGLNETIDREAIYVHLRAWGVKTFFVAFMVGFMPMGFEEFVGADWSAMTSNPVALSGWLITFMFTIDMAFATVGYLLTLRPLDSHIRSASPFFMGWVVALACYPPFSLMQNNNPLDYHYGTAEWSFWLGNYPSVMGFYGFILVGLTAIYAWATVAFGIRFSNLTDRGILTHGPYALSRHPAYLSKNIFWFLSTLPFLTTGNMIDAVRTTVMMALVAGLYYWRAKTEEMHLSADPDYLAYSAWMERNAPVPRFFAMLRGKPRQVPAMPATEG